MENKDDQLIKEMAKLLREGATMLDKTCPKCNTLIYRLTSGKIICPSCNSEIIIQKESSPVPISKIDELNPKNHDFTLVLNSIYNQITSLSSDLNQESDIKKIQKVLDLISRLLDVYERLLKFQTHLKGL